MQLFSAVAKNFLWFFFARKKPPLKVAQKNSNPLFSLTALTAQKAQTEEFMFQNVAYWPTVYRTGHLKAIQDKNSVAGKFFND